MAVQDGRRTREFAPEAWQTVANLLARAVAQKKITSEKSRCVKSILIMVK
jgi:hypothetical protein